MKRKGYIKKLIIMCMIIFVLIINTTIAFAAPDEIAADDAGNTYDLVVITDPPETKSSTFTQSYIVQGHAAEGTQITLYWHDAQANVYRKIYNHVNYYDEYGNLNTDYEEATVTVGSSNLFAKNIELSYGGNNIMIYAEKDGQYQILKFNVTLYDSNNILDLIRSITM